MIGLINRHATCFVYQSHRIFSGFVVCLFFFATTLFCSFLAKPGDGIHLLRLRHQSVIASTASIGYCVYGINRHGRFSDLIGAALGNGRASVIQKITQVEQIITTSVFPPQTESKRILLESEIIVLWRTIHDKSFIFVWEIVMSLCRPVLENYSLMQRPPFRPRQFELS